MMLGKPVVCYLREEWLERMRREIPDYIDELPIVSATPETVEGILKDLVNDPERRRELGERSRAFAVKHHSAQAGARRMDQIYRELLSA
jgi:glycosyltransferase involved in cell wall biosynthesis